MAAPSLQPRSILCVDADRPSRELLQEALGAYRLTLACNAYEALRNVHSGLFDLYLIDQWLPDLGGVQLCREVRKVDPRAPILFTSAAARDDSRKRALRAGATVYLGKPLDANALRNRVHDLLKHADAESLRARVEEERVLQEELARRAQQAIDIAGFSRDRAARAIERGARAKAYRAFIERGGTRAHFERTWPQIFAAAWSRFDVGAAVPAPEPLPRAGGVVAGWQIDRASAGLLTGSESETAKSPALVAAEAREPARHADCRTMSGPEQLT